MKKQIKVFISSTFTDLAGERQAAARAISELQLDALHAEAISVPPLSSDETLASAIDECDVFLGLYGSRYGHTPPELATSVTEFELRRAQETGKDILIYIKDGLEDSEQSTFLRRAQAFEGGDLRRPRFRSADELESAVKDDLEALVKRRFPTHQPAEANSLEDSYRAYVASLYGTIYFAGLARTSGNEGVKLRDLFVEPFLEPYEHASQTSAVLWREAMTLVRQWVLTGPPGCGKTVLLKKIAVDLARSGPEIPILVPLSFTRDQSGHDYKNIESLISTFVGERIDAKFVPVIQKALASGSATLLLDGFDEIDSPSLRESVADGIIDFCQRQPSVQVIVAARQSGISPFVGRLPGYEIRPWSDSQIGLFARQWSAAMTRDLSLSAEPEAQAKELLQLIGINPAIQDLARNPLLMTVLAFLHLQGFRVPARRIELYDVAARTLLSSWDMARSLSHTLGDGVSEARMEELLSSIAFWMVTERLEYISVGKAIALGRRSLAAEDVTDAEVASALQRLVSRSGILLESGRGQYSFVHKSFQEYFAARAIASLSPSESRAFISEHFFDDHYAEVVRLALAWLEGHGGGNLVAEITEELANAARR